MNKYQEAINELKELVHSEFDGTRMLNRHLEYINTLQELVDKYTELNNVYHKHETMETADLNAKRLEEHYKEVEPFINKATPKKRVFVKETPSVSAHDECPVCRAKVSPIRLYCDNCGQRLE